MDPALIASLVGFSFVTCITPGPNNLLLMSSGALFGFRATLPHVAGIQVGFGLIVASAVFGLDAVIDSWPWLLTVVKIGGASWLFWMAARFLRASATSATRGSESSVETISRPFRFYEAVLFQWVNPKAIAIALSAAGAYVAISDEVIERAIVIGAVFFLVGCISSSSWLTLGGALNRSMSSGRHAIMINAAMGVLLLATAIYVLIS
ncbi:MAG: LysE family translocator [Myxococcota bacterium]